MSTSTAALSRERNIILALLLAVTAASWALLIWWPAGSTDSGMGAGMGMHAGLTMGLGAPLFLLFWTVMMAAMMFPAAAPMIAVFMRVQAERGRRGQTFVPTWLFIGGYLLVWVAAGVIAFGCATLADALATRSMWLMGNGARIGAGLLVLAGLYQLSPLKRRCLSHCRTPLQFIMTSWRDGRLGALRMGLDHGVTCLGCCWLLFVILFPLGIMNLAAMAAITLVVFAEKALPRGERVAQLAALALLAFGLAALAAPGILPSTM